MSTKKGVVAKLRKQLVKSVMDLLVIAELRNGSMSGYDAINFIHQKFDVIVSSGTVYSHLYALERDGLIEGKWELNKRVYKLTESGEKTLESIAKTNMELLTILENVINQ